MFASQNVEYYTDHTLQSIVIFLELMTQVIGQLMVLKL